jgi:hypothetical protein
MATIKQVMTLLGKAGIKEELKREMVFNFTNGRTQSVRDLNTVELNIFYNQLNTKTQPAVLELELRKKRSIVLKLATDTGIKTPENWTKFNQWMLKCSVLKKELHAYDYVELDQLIRQFRALKANYSRSAIKVGTKAWHHATGIPTISTN